MVEVLESLAMDTLFRLELFFSLSNLSAHLVFHDESFQTCAEGLEVSLLSSIRGPCWEGACFDVVNPKFIGSNFKPPYPSRF